MKLAVSFRALPPLPRRCLSVGVLALLLAVAWVGVVGPLRELAGSQARWRLEVTQQLARARGELAARVPLAAQARTLPQSPLWQRFYEDRPGASADNRLRQDVGGLLTGCQATADSLILLPARREGQLMSHGVRLSASLTIEQLQAFLVALRAHPRALRVRHLTVTAPLNQPPYTNPPLSLQADVYGFSQVKT